MSFRLRVEDEYAHGEKTYGARGEEADGHAPERTSEEFREFVGILYARRLLPPGWALKDEMELFDGAEENIHIPLEEPDLVELFGRSEVAVLRAIAESALGPVGNWLPFSKYDYDDEDYDEVHQSDY